MKESVKSKIITLVEKSTDDRFLSQVYSILDSREYFGPGKLFDQLTEEQKNDTIQSLMDSHNPEELVDNDEFMKEIRKEFGWN